MLPNSTARAEKDFFLKEKVYKFRFVIISYLKCTQNIYV